MTRMVWCAYRTGRNVPAADIFMLKNKKITIIATVLVLLCAAGDASELFFREKTNDLVLNGRAIMVQAWNTIFPASEEGIAVSDVAIGDADALSYEGQASSIEVPPEDHVADITVAPPAKPSTAAKSAASASSGSASTKTLAPTSTSAAKNNSVPQASGTTFASSSMSASSDVSRAAATTTAEKISVPSCAIPPVPFSPTRKIILNEVAWMGSPPLAGESTASAGAREWFEIKNISSASIDLAGWQVVDASGALRAAVDEHSALLSGGLYLFARGSASTSPLHADHFYSGALSNAGDELFIFDPSCALVDAIDALSGWPGGDNGSKQTLERDSTGMGWHTSVLSGGTPGAYNSIPPVAVASVPAPQSISPAVVAAAVNAPSSTVPSSTIAASTTSSPAEPPCGASCEPSPDNNIEASSTNDGEQASSTPPANTSGTPAFSHLLIVAIGISGASSTNDFIKLFNPGTASVDLQGWKLRKKSSTGSDQSVRAFSEGDSIEAGGYFIWANSTGGFSEAIGANASSTATLAASNSVALFDASGTMVDAVAWGDGADQYKEGFPYPTDPAAGEVLLRRSADGIFIDTNNNADDFVIQ